MVCLGAERGVGYASVSMEGTRAIEVVGGLRAEDVVMCRGVQRRAWSTGRSGTRLKTRMNGSGELREGSGECVRANRYACQWERRVCAIRIGTDVWQKLERGRRDPRY